MPSSSDDLALLWVARGPVRLIGSVEATVPDVPVSDRRRRHLGQLWRLPGDMVAYLLVVLVDHASSKTR